MSFAGEFIGFSVVKLRSCWIELEDSAIQMFERHTSDKLDIFGGAHFVWAPGVADSFRCCPFCGMILPWFCRRKRWSSWAIATSSDETLGLQWQKSPDWALQKPKTLRHCMWVVGLPAVTSFERLVSVFFLASWVNPQSRMATGFGI